jgi:hypothetical protein
MYKRYLELTCRMLVIKHVHWTNPHENSTWKDHLYLWKGLHDGCVSNF